MYLANLPCFLFTVDRDGKPKDIGIKYSSNSKQMKSIYGKFSQFFAG